MGVAKKLASMFMCIAVFMFTGCSPKARVPSVPPPTVSVPESSSTSSVLPPRLTVPRLYAVSDQVAWVLAVEGLFRTKDGGLTWSNVTPSKRAMAMPSALFLDAQVAWVVAHPGPPDGGKGILFKTSNGGSRWEQVEIPFQDGYLSAPDAQHLFALVITAVGAGNSNSILYRSQDGGNTWTRLPAGQPPTQTSLPDGGVRNGLAFPTTSTTGWLTGETPVMGFPYLFLTHDAGQTWREQPLPIPGKYRQTNIRVGLPQFKGDVGILPAHFTNSQGQTDNVIYVSHDGGTSWQSLPPLQTQAGKPILYSFADASHGWAADETPEHGVTLYQTQDGGRTWQSVRTIAKLNNMGNIQFTSATIGWAQAVTEKGPSILRTTDGGQTWQAIYSSNPLLPPALFGPIGSVFLRFPEPPTGWCREFCCM